MDNINLKPYKYNGARSMVIMHELHMKSLLQTWKAAKKINLTLPKTNDPSYKSLETLLFHVFRAARGYMTWMCEKLKLPDPEIKPAPRPELIEKEADEYLVHLLEKWRTPLAEVEGNEFIEQTYTSRWGIDYCIDAMLEHAVMHPIRHEFQLKNLMGKK